MSKIKQIFDSRISVLVVDDFSMMRHIMKNVLKQLGFVDIHEADSGVTALVKLRSERIHLVFLDWHMPEMNGFELLQTIRNDPELAHLPVILITAEAQRHQISQALELGIQSYLLKPFTVTTLSEKISKVLSQYPALELNTDASNEADKNTGTDTPTTTAAKNDG